MMLSRKQFAVFACFVVVVWAGLFAQQEGELGSERWYGLLKEDFKDLPDQFLADAEMTFTKEGNIFALLTAGGASVALHNTDADENIQDYLNDHQTFSGGYDEALNIAGNPVTHFAAAGLWYVLSADNGNELNRQRAWTMIRALSVNGAATMSLKLIVNNDTPNGGDLAWPSGHTSSSFTVASVLDEFYGSKVGIPAYAGATVVGWRMMDAGDHWASDVVFGATLGWVIGHSVAGEGKVPEVAGFTPLPMTSIFSRRAVSGICFVKNF